MKISIQVSSKVKYVNHGMYQKSVYKIKFYILSVYSFLCMCCKVIISDAK